jgi:deoxyribodipyrimidine photo-lyase
MFSPFHRSWIDALNKHLEWIEEAPVPKANPPSIRNHTTFGSLFTSEVPATIEGFECSDKESMAILWPAGNDAAKQVCWDLLPSCNCHIKLHRLSLGF